MNIIDLLLDEGKDLSEDELIEFLVSQRIQLSYRISEIQNRIHQREYYKKDPKKYMENNKRYLKKRKLKEEWYGKDEDWW